MANWISLPYVVVVKHDEGTTKIDINASSEEKAKEMVMRIEGCPESAIIDTYPKYGERK